MQSIYVKYHIGLKSYTKKMPIDNQEPIHKQFQISLPLITGATVKYKEKKELTIMVGKEINLQKIMGERYKIQKYNLNVEELADLALQGYAKACLLNYKKYDQIIIGLKKEDLIVPDYYALKRVITSIADKCFNRG